METKKMTKIIERRSSDCDGTGAGEARKYQNLNIENAKCRQIHERLKNFIKFLKFLSIYPNYGIAIRA